MSNPVPIITGRATPLGSPTGDIKFYDRFAPPLPAGQYTVSTSQTVLGAKDINNGADPLYTAPDQAVLITGPRFSLSAKNVFSMYPPADSAGAFIDHLPHVVLSQRSFPWARSIVDLAVEPNPSPAPTPATPWLAVLTFYSADIQRPNDPLNPNPSGPVSPPKTMQVAAIVAANATILTPKIQPTTTENTQQAQVVEMTYAFFKSIAPSQTDLPFLAHGRQVNTEGKAVVGAQAEGFFSVAVGNRVLLDGDTQTAVLVSLEGHWDRLPGGSDASNPANNAKSIRLVILASWSFTALPSGGDFLYLMSQLDVTLLRLPATGPTDAPDTDPAAQAVQALALGYVPLTNDLRDGEKTTSYYRGPGAAAPCATDMDYGPYHYSDSTIHYDPTFGTFNLSYAAAFQVGRLLALSDGSFAAALVRWRNDYFYRTQNTVTDSVVMHPLMAAMDVSPSPDAGTTTQMRHAVRSLWHGTIGARLLEDPSAIPAVQPRHLRAASSDKPGLLTPEEIEELRASGEDPLATLREKLAAPATDSPAP
jgi:hypothetical protein